VDLLKGCHRREFFKFGIGSALWWMLSRGGQVLALREASKFAWAQVIYNGRWNLRASGEKRLLWELAKRTSVDVALEPLGVRLMDSHLGRYPFLCVCGDGGFPSLSREEAQALRAHLTSGGMLFADDVSGEADGRFSRGLKAALSKVFPEKEWKQLPQDHSVFRSFYLLNGAVGRNLASPFFEGIDHEDRTPVILSRNDLLGAWARDEFGSWGYQVIPGGEAQREMAFRLGINIVLYALTVNYKKDQIHQPFILQRRR